MGNGENEFGLEPEMEEESNLALPYRIASEIGQFMALLAVGLYALLFLIAILQNTSEFYDAERQAVDVVLNYFDTGVTASTAPTRAAPVAAAAPAAGVVLVEVLVFIVICIIAILVLYVCMKRWMPRVERRIQTIRRCNWTASILGFFKCLWHTVKVVVEFLVWALVTIVSAIVTAINIAVLAAGLGIAVLGIFGL